jgi:hypothetical protein
MPITPEQAALIERNGIRVSEFLRAGEGCAYDIGPSPSVHLTENGWELVPDWDARRDSFDANGFDTRDEAFAALEQTDWFREAVRRKQPEKLAGTNGARLASPRWFDAAAVEELPAATGGQVTETAIDEMVRNLAGVRKAPIIDGGGLGNVHASAHATDTEAAGYVYAGVKVVGDDPDDPERAHLWLYGSLLPEVDERVDSGKIVYGSICFSESSNHPYTNECIGAVLISYALTNSPYIEGLEPHQPRSRNVTGPSALIYSRSTPIMPKRSQGPDTRGPEDHATAPTLPAPAAGAAPGTPPAPDGARAEGDTANDPAKLEQAIAMMVAEAERISGQSGLSPEQALDILRGLPEIKSPGDPEKNAGPGGQDEARSSGGGQGRDQERSATRVAETVALRAQLTKLDAEVKALRAVQTEREMQDHIEARYTAAKLPAPKGDDREELMGVCRDLHAAGKDWKRVVERSLRAVNVPPQGLATAPNEHTRAAGVEPASQKEAIDLCKADLRARRPELDGKALRAEAYELVKQRYPHLVNGTERDASARS